MRNKILALQFRVNPATVKQEQLCLEREMGSLVDIEFKNVLTQEIDFSDPKALLFAYQGVVLGGSGDLDFDGDRPVDDEVRLESLRLVKKLTPLFEHLFAADIPTLGICYGHQLLGAYAGARVCCDPVQKKTKSHQLSRLVSEQDCEIFKGIPETFDAYYGHKDVLDRVPEGAVLLAHGGDTCQISALQYRNNIYTVQFHPELTYQDMLERMTGSTGYLPDGMAFEELYKKDICSNTILHNFASVVESK